MAKIRDPKADIGHRSARAYLRPVETEGTRLAHWPPPYRAKESKPVIMGIRAEGWRELDDIIETRSDPDRVSFTLRSPDGIRRRLRSPLSFDCSKGWLAAMRRRVARSGY